MSANRKDLMDFILQSSSKRARDLEDRTELSDSETAPDAKRHQKADSPPPPPPVSMTYIRGCLGHAVLMNKAPAMPLFRPNLAGFLLAAPKNLSAEDIRQYYTACETTLYSLTEVVLKSPYANPQQKPIFTIEELPYFLNVVAQQAEVLNSVIKVDEQATKAARYIVTSNNKIIFAQQGPRSAQIPSHAETAKKQQVRAAGDVVFVKQGDRYEIVSINNQSSGYQPRLEAALYALVEMHRAKIPLAERVEIQEWKGKTWLVNRSDIAAFAQTLSASASSSAAAATDSHMTTSASAGEAVDDAPSPVSDATLRQSCRV